MLEQNYNGPERRASKVDSIELMIKKIEEIFDLKFQSLERRLDKNEEDTRKDFETFRANLENLFHISDHRTRLDIDDLKVAQSKLEKRIKDLEDAPLKKAADVQHKFFTKGRDMIGGAIWTAIIGAFVWLLVNYGHVKLF